MKLICLTICLISIFSNEVDSGRSGLTLSSAKITADEKDRILKTLDYLENSFLNKSDPQHGETIRRFESFKREVPVLSEGFLNHLIQLCKEGDAHQEMAPACLQNQAAYLRKNFSDLRTTVENFVAQTFVDHNKRITEGWKEKGELTLNDALDITYNNFSILQRRLNKLYTRLLDETDRNKTKYNRKLASFDFEISAIFDDVYNSVVMKCTDGKHEYDNAEITRCYQSLPNYIEGRFKPLYERIREIEEEPVFKDCVCYKE